MKPQDRKEYLYHMRRAIALAVRNGYGREQVYNDFVLLSTPQKLLLFDRVGSKSAGHSSSY